MVKGSEKVEMTNKPTYPYPWKGNEREGKETGVTS